MLDSVYHWNVRGVLRALHSAEVVTVFFRYLGRALVLDMRCDEQDAPLIAVDTLAGGTADRVARLKRLRPRFPAPEDVTLLGWHGSVRSFDRRGGLEEVAARLRRLGYASAIGRLQQAYEELLRLEREEARSLIQGNVERTQTLYQRPASKP